MTSIKDADTWPPGEACFWMEAGLRIDVDVLSIMRRNGSLLIRQPQYSSQYITGDPTVHRLGQYRESV